MRTLVVALVLLGSLAIPAVTHAQRPVLQIDGIPQQIDVQSWSWGVTQTGSARAGAGGGAGRAEFEPLTVTKRVDASSPQLFVDTASGKHFPGASLTVRAADGGTLRYILSDVMISGLTVDDSTGESVSLTYGKIELEHRAPGQATPVTAGWDVRPNRRL
ncbi:MAG: Hcp family type VI secretion system effector [Gemmatimonadota bacterium]